MKFIYAILFLVSSLFDNKKFKIQLVPANERFRFENHNSSLSGESGKNED